MPQAPPSDRVELLRRPRSNTGAFLPGVILAERYRIIARVGRGGMGEVFRADDLRLGQPVALKFLPPELEQDEIARERLLAEVRLARTIAHPNVCRVYDIGDLPAEGDAPARTFLSMEYIDGEDLGSLLRRIGRLTPNKALDIARQLCAAGFGIMAGYATGADAASARSGLPELMGACVTAFAVATLVAAAVTAMRAAWLHTVARVLASWLAAVGMLAMGWLLRT